MIMTLRKNVKRFKGTRIGAFLWHAYLRQKDPTLARAMKANDLSGRFDAIYRGSHWFANGESQSGSGSTLASTARIRKALPEFLLRREICSIFDAGCGDFNWMRAVDVNILYIGGDIVPTLVDHLSAEFTSPLRRFMVIDITSDVPPKVDLILCREVLFHLSNANVMAALRRFRRSQSKFLLTTLDREVGSNVDISDGDQRSLNLSLPPFNLPPPLEMFDDAENVDHRSLALWPIDDLPV